MQALLLLLPLLSHEEMLCWWVVEAAAGKERLHTSDQLQQYDDQQIAYSWRRHPSKQVAGNEKVAGGRTKGAGHNRPS
jgi:hypothetical protein